MHHPGVDNVLEYDPDVDDYEDDEPLERLREIVSRPADLLSVEPVSVLDVASGILQELGPVDTYKLQKLCYYAQAHHVAMYSTRLFREPIEAWPHGPVIRALWNRHARKREIERLPEGDPMVVKEEAAAADTLSYVLSVYGAFTGEQLKELTHREGPWLEARAGLRPKEPSDREIPVEVLRDYYRSFPEIESVDDLPPGWWTST